MAPRSALNAALAGLVLAATGVSAHGIATALVVFPTGTFFKGYNPSYQYEKPPPVVVGWSTPDDLQNTFVSPSAYGSADIACHIGATPAGAEAPVNAGDTIEIQWTPWPASHKGPVLDYLAKCDGPCTSADKSKLKFFKISEVGLIDAASDLWGATQLASNNNSWLVTIPKDIAPGNYVLRNEIIALHAAGQTNGAQNYPFCYSLAISSSGTANPEGILATSLYTPTDPGIKFDLFTKFTQYKIPGPPLYSNAIKVVQSKAPAIKGTAVGIPSLVFEAKPTSVVVATATSTAATPAVTATKQSTTIATPATTQAVTATKQSSATTAPATTQTVTATKQSTATTSAATTQVKHTTFITKIGTTRVTVTTHMKVTMTTTLG